MDGLESVPASGHCVRTTLLAWPSSLYITRILGAHTHAYQPEARGLAILVFASWSDPTPCITPETFGHVSELAARAEENDIYRASHPSLRFEKT